MPLPRIAAVATATPKHRFDQAALLALAGYVDERRRGFFSASDIEGRHLYIDPGTFTPNESVDEMNARFQGIDGRFEQMNGRFADFYDRLGDVRDTLRAEMSKNHSEMLSKFAELDLRLSRLEAGPG